MTDPPPLFKGQLLHFGFLAVVLHVLHHHVDAGSASWGGLPVVWWYRLAIAVPVAHQIYVWLSWRLQLRDQAFTSCCGLEKGFRIYVVGFFALFGSRFLTLLLLALADQGSVDMAMPLRLALAAPIFALSGYTMYSMKTYFGFKRAAGIDHFDPGYRSKPLVREGAFKWTGNAMYVFALQGTWLFGILAASKLAMIVAAFQTVYIWVHYFATEKPDMEHLYGA